MSFAHHSSFPVWMEMARTELLRSTGIHYADLEKQGVFIAVARINCSFHKPARYDDQLQVTATLTRASGAKIEHDYRVVRDGQVLMTGSTTLAVLDAAGRPQRVPKFLHAS